MLVEKSSTKATWETMIGICSLGDKVEKISIVKKFLQFIPPSRFMQIVTFIEQFDVLNKVLVEDVIVHHKANEETFCGYNNREEEKHFLLTHEKWFALTKEKDSIDSSFSGKKERDDVHNKETKGHGNGRGHGYWGGHDNISQTHYDVNP